MFFFIIPFFVREKFVANTASTSYTLTKPDFFFGIYLHLWSLYLPHNKVDIQYGMIICLFDFSQQKRIE